MMDKSKLLFVLVSISAELIAPTIYADAESYDLFINDHSVQVNESHRIKFRGGRNVTDPDSNSRLIMPAHNGRLNLEIPLSLSDRSQVTFNLPSGQTLTYDLLSEDGSDITVWQACQNQPCKETGYISRLKTSANLSYSKSPITLLWKGARLRLFSDQEDLLFIDNGKPAFSHYQLPMVVITSAPAKPETAFSKEQINVAGGSYTYGDSDDKGGKRRPAYPAPPQLPLFSFLDMLGHKDAGIFNVPGLSGYDIARNAMPGELDYDISNKADYLNRVVQNQDRVVQVWMLYRPMKTGKGEETSASALSEEEVSLATIMNWLAETVPTENDLYQINKMLLEQVDCYFQSQATFTKNYINSKNHLRTAMLLKSWKSKLGNKLAATLKNALKMMGYQIPPHITKLLDQLAPVQEAHQEADDVASQPVVKKRKPIIHQVEKRFCGYSPHAGSTTENYYSEHRDGHQNIHGTSLSIMGLPGNVQFYQPVNQPFFLERERRVTDPDELEKVQSEFDAMRRRQRILLEADDDEVTEEEEEKNKL